MKDHRNFLPIGTLCAAIVLIFLSNSCRYDYSSPLPGTIDIRLHTYSTKIPFQANNNFVLKVSQVNAIRQEDGARVTVYEDPSAINRTLNIFNTLDFQARDSVMIMGQTPVPPAVYNGVDLTIRPGASVILDGYRNIVVKLPAGFDPTLHFLRSFEVKELWTTRIILTINLDSTLVKGANNYYFVPHYKISSVEYFPPQ